MIVTHQNFVGVVDALHRKARLAIDTETYGLRPYHGHRLFSIIVADEKDAYYFNFKNYDDNDVCFTWPQTFPILQELFAADKRTFIFHNAKFDLAMLAQEGLHVKGKIHDTMVIARVLDSTLMHDFSLDSLAKTYGYRKDTAVEEYIQKNLLFTYEMVPGKKQRIKNMHYDRVPFEIISKYGENDARITYDIAIRQTNQMAVLQSAAPPKWPTLSAVFYNENKLVGTVFSMEQRGVRIDQDFCRKAIEHETNRMQAAEKTFLENTGKPLKTSSKLFKEVFADEEFEYLPQTETGQINPTFNSQVLEGFTSPLAKLILEYRDAKSKMDFYHGFIYHTDPSGYLHTSLNQHVPKTGRFSSSNPNLQNLTSAEGVLGPYTVRRAIVPSAGNALVMIDYKQMEYYLLLEYAKAMGLIERVRGGADVHQATADLTGLSRSVAKTANFSIIYGSGVAAMAKKMEISETAAAAVKDAIFQASPEIEMFVRNVKLMVKNRDYIFNWFGRRYVLAADEAYKGVNYIIQGGCADVVKIGMNRVEEFLQGKKTKMVLSVHDELVFDADPSEFGIFEEIKKILESVYPAKFLPLAVDVSYSYKSLADKNKGMPQ